MITTAKKFILKFKYVQSSINRSLVGTEMYFWFHIRQVTLVLAEQLLASEKGLTLLEIYSFIISFFYYLGL
jgi:hypothetical protein